MWRRLSVLVVLAASTAVGVVDPNGVVRADEGSGPPVAGLVATPYRKNLLQDASAEQAVGADGYAVVAIPGWRQVSNFTAVPYGASGFPSVDEGTRIGGGALFFAGGPDNSSSWAVQRVVLVGRRTAVDAGQVRVKASAWLSGWDGQPDAAQIVVRFLRGDGSIISTMRTVAVSATNNVFAWKAVSRIAPVGTRMIEVVLSARRGAGSYNDGYFDKVDLRILPA